MKKFHDKKSFKEIRDDLLKQKSNFEDKEKRLLFETIELDSYKNFLKSLDPDCNDKIVDTIERAKDQKNSNLFKKLNDNIWEFRVNHKHLHYRLLAFWHSVDNQSTVFITHGFLKKTNKIPLKELNRAIEIRSNYLNNN